MLFNPQLLTKPTKRVAASLGLQTGLSAFWELETTSWLDSVGSNALTGSNTPLAVPGKVGNALQVIKVTSQEVHLLPNSILDFINTDFSVQAWVFPYSLADGAGIVLNGAAPGNRVCHLEIFFDSGGYKLRWNVSDSGGGGGTTVDALTFSFISVGNWYHVVGTYKHATKAMNIYVNGSLSDSGTASSSPGVSSDYFMLGWNFNEYWDGVIDQVGIWKGRELSAGDVTSLYAAGNGLSYSAMA